MINTIWKFTVAIIEDVIFFDMPRGARILCVQMQGSRPRIWAMVDTTNVAVERIIYIRGTGNNLGVVGPSVPYIGTAQMESGLVWHFFDGGESK